MEHLKSHQFLHSLAAKSDCNRARKAFAEETSPAGSEGQSGIGRPVGQRAACAQAGCNTPGKPGCV